GTPHSGPTLRSPLRWAVWDPMAAPGPGSPTHSPPTHSPPTFSPSTTARRPRSRNAVLAPVDERSTRERNGPGRSAGGTPFGIVHPRGEPFNGGGVLAPARLLPLARAPSLMRSPPPRCARATARGVAGAPPGTPAKARVPARPGGPARGRVVGRSDAIGERPRDGPPENGRGRRTAGAGERPGDGPPGRTAQRPGRRPAGWAESD